MMKIKSILIFITILFQYNACKQAVTPPPDNGPPQNTNLHRILIASNKDNASNLYFVNPGDTVLKRITHPQDSISFGYASLSPDLVHIAVLWNSKPERKDEYPKLATMDTSGNSFSTLVDYCAPTTPVWSPSGDRIAFSRPRSGYGGPWDIYIISVNGGPRTPVTDYINTTEIFCSSTILDWLSENTLLIGFQRDSLRVDTSGTYLLSSKHVIYEIDLQGNMLRTVLDSAAIFYFSARISPDKTKVVYTYSDRNGHCGIGIADGDGSHRKKIGKELNYYYSEDFYSGRLCWSPDGQYFLYTAILNKQLQPVRPEIWIVDKSGTEFKTLVPDSVYGYFAYDWR